jgi:DNA repair photolyase
MPTCGSQMPICDVPIRYDTYKGCTHACTYCFVKRLSDIREVKIGEGPKALEEFIKGKRTKITSWCDWDIPIHWGGVSDPFQPCEKIHKKSLDSLKILKESNYPYIVSTKSILPIDNEYFDLISGSNCVFQISAVSSKYDEYEKGASTYNQRLEMMRVLAPVVKRLVVRVQPYVLEVERDVIKSMDLYSKIGVYGIVVEGMKYRTKRKDTVRFEGDNVINIDMLRSSLNRVKSAAHEAGLVFLCGENRLRSMGDSLTCCGCEGLDGFNVNTYNINSFNCGRKTTPTDAQNKKGTASGFITVCQGMEHKYGLALEKASFAETMERYYRKHKGIIG